MKSLSNYLENENVFLVNVTHQNASARWRHDRAVETHLHRGLEKALKVLSPDDRRFLKPPRIGVNKERVRWSPKIMRWRHRAHAERPKALGLKYSSFRQGAAADFPPKAEVIFLNLPPCIIHDLAAAAVGLLPVPWPIYRATRESISCEQWSAKARLRASAWIHSSPLRLWQQQL